MIRYSYFFFSLLNRILDCDQSIKVQFRKAIAVGVAEKSFEKSDPKYISYGF
jgi:hypothetical protein